MDFKLYAPFLAFLMLLVATEAADLASSSVPPEIYWNSMLPNVPMPAAIRDIIDLGKKNQGKSVRVKLVEINDEEDSTLYFVEQDILPGNTMNLHFTKTTNEATFVPRRIADAIPFSLNKLTEVFYKHAGEPDLDDTEANIIRKTMQRCEELRIKGEEYQSCLPSLESMIDFVTTHLGHDVRAITTEMKQVETQLAQNYTVEYGVRKVEGSKFVACHKLNYPYAMYICHAFDVDEGNVVRVPLKGSNGAKVVGIGVCHIKPKDWDWVYMSRLPARMAVVKSRKVPLCHFLAGDSIVWTNKMQS